MTTFQFPLFDSPLVLAHHFFSQVLSSDDIVIDATCGQGFDSLYLIPLIPSGHLHAIDIQKQAIDSTAKKLEMFKNFTLHHTSHEIFPKEIKKDTVKLVVYNLGYLPKGDKEITTKTETTLNSIKNSLDLIVHGGVVSIMCYPGHPEGEKELQAVVDFSKNLEKFSFLTSIHKLLNRDKAPVWIVIQKKKDKSECFCG
jgi:SAM-dependent methyltransferase